MAQETNNGASLHYKLFLNQKCVKVWILGSYLMFLPADSLIKGDGKDWRKTVVSSDVHGFHLSRIKGYQDSS